ncbi:MAG TPA: T9SS type A sorting domain-containing protein [Chitinophagales bacterium]|nr:T9SS type A sorting domain-containing protein [Chitinophagales bacterium]
MNHQYPKIVFCLVFIWLGYISKASNDTLTIGRVFDWKAGDSLVYDFYEHISYPTPPNGPGVINQHSKRLLYVESRTQLNDTLIYKIRWQYGMLDSLLLSNSDTSVTKLSYSVLYSFMQNWCRPLETMPTVDSSWANAQFNGQPVSPIDTLSSIWISYPQFETFYSISFTERVGLRHAYFNALEYIPGISSFQGYYGGCGVKLVRYKSDSLTWTDPDFYLSIAPIYTEPNFGVYPNPATNSVSISWSGVGALDVFIYDLAGSSVLNNAGVLNSPVQIKLDNIPNGYYLVKVSDRHGFTRAKSLVVAK